MSCKLNHAIRRLMAMAVIVPALAQAPVFPAWLEPYPGATATAHSSPLLAESTYTASAPPSDVLAHYRKLFEAAKLPFQPNPDGIGTSIRAAAPECDLLILIRTREPGTLVDVNCAARSAAASASTDPAAVIVTQPRSSRPIRAVAPIAPPRSPAEVQEQHDRLVAELGIHAQHRDQPAPPLAWPGWLVHLQGSALNPRRGVDQARNPTLTARYTTTAPMTEILSFYRDLLKSHEYSTSGGLETGQTIKGVVQNAFGKLEGSNYPDGAPGAHTGITINFDRSVLNGPITVTLRFTAYAFIAARGY